VTEAQLERFRDLACQLSPENISCDGECSRAETGRRARKVWAEWRQLEHEVGRRVTEVEVWGNL
jgi:hypothetical protein